MLEAVEAQLRTLNRYPGPDEGGAAAPHLGPHGVPAGRMAMGNGSCELLLAGAEAMLEPGAEVVYAWPSFSIYPQMAAKSGARAITVPLNEAGEHDLAAMAREVNAATRMVIVCNPNNPTANGAAAGRDRRVRRRAAASRGGDARRGVRGVLDAAGPGRVARPARGATRT